MVATTGNDDRTIVASVVEKIQQGRDELTSNDIQQLQAVLGRQKQNNHDSDAAADGKEEPPAIPYLNRNLLQTQGTSPTLVRYVGMVQDMLDTEYYAAKIRGIRTHYRDYYYDASTAPKEEELATDLAERQPLVLVPVPYASDWMQKYLVGDTTQENAAVLVDQDDRATGTTTRKRERKDGESALVSTKDDTASPQPFKARTTDTPETTDTSHDSMDTSTEAPVDDKPAVESSSWWPTTTHTSTQPPVLAKLYYDLNEATQDRTNDRLRLNDVVECIGMLSMDPMEADFRQQTSASDTEDDFLLDRPVLPPPSVMPRLHVVCFNKIHNLDDIVVGAADMDVGASDPNTERDEIIQLLSDCVFDGSNPVAAEALLLVLLSMAQRELKEEAWSPAVKTPMETTLGCASLNFVMPDAASCAVLQDRLTQLFSLVVPVAASMELSRQGLETTASVLHAPYKNEEGRLTESVLQLPQGAALVINQATLTEGPIPPRAVETLQALASLTKSHTVSYKFDGNMTFPFEADYRVLVLSTSENNNGSRSATGSKLLPCTLNMKVALSDGDSTMHSELSEESALRIRSYLAHCRTTGVSSENNNNISLSKDLLLCAEKDFVQRRVDDRLAKEASSAQSSADDEIGEDDFHRWLTLTRLQARSRMEGRGISEETMAGVQCWKDALRLDDSMKSA